MRILVAESTGFSQAAGERLRSVGPVTFADLDRPALLDAVGDAEVLFVRLRNRVDVEVMDAAPGLRAVVSPTTGRDHLDLAAAEARGIAVLTLFGETDFLRTVTATAEHTWALLLALVRQVPQAGASVAAGAWDRDRFRGRELSGKTLGVVGLGRLGSMVARYGAAFGMTVVGHDPFLPAWPDGVVRCDTLEEVLARADVVTLHVPLNDDTRAFMGAPQLGLMRPGAYLVNTSRGDLVDEAALVAAVSSGHLAGAALDVVAGEGDPAGPAGSPAVRFAATDPRILVTPHIGGATLESMENTEIFMAEKLESWIRGAPVRVDAGPAAALAPEFPPIES